MHTYLPPPCTAEANATAPGDGSASQQQTISDFLSPVSEVLAQSRREVFGLAAQRIMELVNMPGLLKGEDYPQVWELCNTVYHCSCPEL